MRDKVSWQLERLYRGLNRATSEWIMAEDKTSESSRRQAGKFRNSADCLRQSKAVIIDTWLKKVRESLPAAKSKSRPILLNSLDALLDEVIESLDKGILEKGAVAENARKHAIQRSTLEDYDLKQVLVEYRILRGILFDLLDREVEFHPAERNIVLDLIHLGMAAAAENYSDAMSQRTTAYSAKLRQAKERLRMAIDYAKIGVFDDDFLNGELLWSERMQEMWGYRPNEFTGKFDQLWSHVHPDDRIRIENAIELVESNATQGTTFTLTLPIDFRMMRKAG